MICHFLKIVNCEESERERIKREHWNEPDDDEWAFKIHVSHQ